MSHNSSSFGVLFTKFSTNFSFVFFQETVLESSFSVWKGEQKNKQTNKNRLVKIIFFSKAIENIVYTSISRRRIFFYSSSK